MIEGIFVCLCLVAIVVLLGVMVVAIIDTVREWRQ